MDTVSKFTARGEEAKREPMSLLIISTQEFCERLKGALSKIGDEKYKKCVRVKLAVDVEQVFSSGLQQTSIDYAAIVCDTTQRNTIPKALEQIHLLGSLAATRLCLVNGSPKRGLEGSAADIIKLASVFNLPYINGEIMTAQSCERVAERLMETAATSCGFYTGIPFVLPTPYSIFVQLASDNL